MPWTRSVVVWLALMLAESLHGILRTRFLAPVIGDFPARRVSVLSGLLLIFLITFASFRWLGAHSVRMLLGIGALWVALTVLFEIGIGRFVLGFDWERILSDYDLARGGLMGVGLLGMLLIPLVVAKLRSPARSAGDRSRAR
jgi:hypothetical protein